MKRYVTNSIVHNRRILRLYRNAAWKSEVFVQDIGKCFLSIFTPERGTAVEHLIQQNT